MALRVRFQYATGATLGYSIERLLDGLLYDFADSTFKTTPTTPIAALPGDTGIFVGRYRVTLTPTDPAQFTDGAYCVTIHNLAASNTVVGELAAELHNGDDAPVFPSGAGSDPLANPVPGGYGPGTAGYILGTNLNATVESRLPTSSYVAPSSSVLDLGTVSGSSNVAAPYTITVTGLTGLTGQYNGRRLYLTFGDGSHLVTNPCTTHVVASGTSVFTFAAAQNRTAAVGTSARVLGS